MPDYRTRQKVGIDKAACAHYATRTLFSSLVRQAAGQQLGVQCRQQSLPSKLHLTSGRRRVHARGHWPPASVAWASVTGLSMARTKGYMR